MIRETLVAIQEGTLTTIVVVAEVAAVLEEDVGEEAVEVVEEEEVGVVAVVEVAEDVLPC